MIVNRGTPHECRGGEPDARQSQPLNPTPAQSNPAIAEYSWGVVLYCSRTSVGLGVSTWRPDQQLRNELHVASQEFTASPSVIAIAWSLVLWGTGVTLAAEMTREPLDAKFQVALQSLATKCDELGLPEQAAVTRRWHFPRDPRRQYLFLPAAADPTQPPDDAPDLVRKWHARFTDLRRAQARGLYELAASLATSQPAQAYQLLHEVLREDPDHAEARRVLGYGGEPGAWTQKSRRPRSERGRGTQRDFGWGRGAYWQIESEHFQITTNHSPEAGIEVAEQLEDFLTAWRQVLFGQIGGKGALEDRLGGGGRPLIPKRRYQIVLFRDQAEYVDQLRKVEPNITKTIGFYSSRLKRSFFYAGDDSLRATRFHEITHQLLQETERVVPQVGERSDFWVVEGIALYMESFERGDGYATLGGFDSNRLQFARYRALSERAYLPLATLITYSRSSLQADKEIQALYSQAAGLTHFLMDQRPIYRQGLLKYLEAVYQGRPAADILPAECGADWGELDRQYHEFLDVTDAELAHMRPARSIRNLCLAHTHVTDAALLTMPTCDALEWLDLSFTPASNAAVARQVTSGNLQQLSLEKTAVTDELLASLAKLRSLEQLDLSQTAVTDAGLVHLAGLENLTVLWLTSTQVSDAGLVQLQGLKKLELLDLSQTRVTPDAWNRLKANFPKLKDQ